MKNHLKRPVGVELGLLGVFLGTFLVITSAGTARAQVTASVSGRVEDPSGAAVPTATVTVTSLETGATRPVASDEGGNYRVLSLPVGLYAIKAEKVGFSAAVQTGINLVVGQQAVVNLKLEVGAVQQEVTVSAEASVVNTTTASVSGLVGERQVKDLPLNGRSFDNLITLNAGAINYTSKTISALGGGFGNSFEVAGRRPEANLFLLNGVEYTGTSHLNVTPGGVSGQLLGIDAVREFNVVIDAYSAEYGKRPGAQVSVVTQSGTNQFHGSIFEFLRNSKLDARNFFDQGTVPPFKRNQFGGAAGGPIRKDKTFIFGNYEGFRQRLGLSDVTFVPDDNARRGLLPCVASGVPACADGNPVGTPTPVPNLDTRMLPYMAFWPEPNGPNRGGGVAIAYSNPGQQIREDFGTARLDQNFSSRDSLAVAYTVDDGYNLTPMVDPLFGGITNLRNMVASIQEEHIFSPEIINTFRAGFSRAKYFFNVPPLVSFPANLSLIAGMVPGAISIGGGTGANTASFSPITGPGNNNAGQWSGRNLFTYSDDVQLIKGKHQFSLGAWFQRLQDNRSGTATKAGAASFTSLQTFLQGTVQTFTGVINPVPQGYRMLMGAWYAQDNITLRPNLSLRLGVRHEFTNGWNEVLGREANFISDSNGVLETAPLVGKIFTENNAKRLFSPRVGLAWDPFGKGKTSIRTGFGLYYHVQDALGFQQDSNPPFNGVITFGQNTSLPPLVPVNPGIPTPRQCGPGVPQPCTIYVPRGVQSTMQTPAVEEWNFTVEQQITSNTALRATYVGSHGYHQLISLDGNTIHPQICASPGGCVSGGINAVKGNVPQGAEYIPVGTRPNPFLLNGYFWYSEGNSSYNALQLDVTHRFSRGLQFRANYSWSKSLDDGSGLSGGPLPNSQAFLMTPYDPKRDWGPAAQDINHQASLSGSYELPWGRGKPWLSGVTGAADKLASGWQVNWIVTLLSGLPYNPQAGASQSGNGDTRNTDRPSRNPAFTGPITLGSQNQWFNPKAFLFPMSGTWGNLSRDPLKGPGLGGLDLSLFKNTALTERARLEFRAEFFNLLNRANFNFPNPTVFSASGAINPTAGFISQTATTSRQIQFGLKLVF